MLKYPLIYLLVVCGLANAISVRGQDYPMLHFTIENGLPSNNIYSIYRDHDDFLWVATDKGILRYNGITFERFTTSDGLPDNDVFFFQEDKEHRLWLMCYNGEMCFYKDGIFHTAANTPYLKLPFKHTFCGKIEVEADSSVTFLYVNMPAVISIKDERLRYISFADQLPKPDVDDAIALKMTDQGQYAFVFAKTTYIADTLNGIVAQHGHKIDDYYKYSFNNNQRYLHTPGGIYSMNEDLLLAFINKVIATSTVYTVSRYDNNWFICTDHGLFVNNSIQMLEGNKVTSVTQDAEGNYWISSLNNGVFYVRRDFLTTAQYSGIYKSQIKYARVAGNDLYYTEDNGNLYRVSGKKRKELVNYVKLAHKFNMQSLIPEHQLGCGPGKLIDEQFNYFSVEYPCGFVVRGINTNSPKIYFHREMRMDNCKEILDAGDKIYMRAGNFINTCQKKDLFAAAIRGGLCVSKTDEKRVYTIALGHDGNLWYSLADSVYKIENGKPKAQPQFDGTAFKQMYITGDVLAGISQKNQLVVCDNFNQKITVSTYTGDKCVCDKMYKLNDSTFLVSTDNQYRLLRVYSSPARERYSVQVVENTALPLQAEYVCNNDSLAYFFKNGNLTCIPVSSIFVHTSAPRIYFKYLKTRNNTYPITTEMVLGYNESKNITISFMPFSFGSRSLKCEYSISKDSSDYWRPVNNNEINLADAGYGVHIVKVKARTLSGEFCAPYVFRFTVSKPYWATWWFFTLIGLCILLAVMLIIRNNRKRVAKERNYLEKELSNLRLQMNPHFLFNTLNSIYSLSKINSAKTPDMVLKLSEMLRYVTYKSDKPLTTISEEIEIIDHYVALQAVRFENRVAINRQVTIDEPETMIVPLLLLPLIENAYKHGIGMKGDNSFIHISIKLEQKILRMDIRNSIAAESVKQDTGEGLGLTNTRRQLALLYKEHELTVSDLNGIFALQLTINIESYAGAKLSDSRR